MTGGKPISSICWDCARACGLSEVQCSWFSKKRTMPEGAKFMKKRVNWESQRKAQAGVETYIYVVQECPEFWEETAEVKAELARIRAKKAEVKTIGKSGLCRLNLNGA